MKNLYESSLSILYKNTVEAFPKTTKRQHAVDPIEIENLYWVPYQGVKTLFVKAEVRNESRHYKTIILFKNVDYNKNEVYINANDNKIYKFGKLSLEHNDVLLRCNCPDFNWRFNYFNYLDKSLYGTKRSEHQNKTGILANPMEMSGVCKHILATVRELNNLEIFLN